MTGKRAREERAAVLRALLRDVQVAEHWQPWDPTSFVDVAVRRWISSDRRVKPAQLTSENRIRELLRGLREARREDVIYEEPGWLEHLADRFGAALLAADQDESISPASSPSGGQPSRRS
jgi:hypothetical protein